MNFFKAELETPNFTFEAYDKTEKGAKKIVLLGWIAHAKQYNVSESNFSEDDITVMTCSLGEVYRDKQVMNLKPPTVDLDEKF